MTAYTWRNWGIQQGTSLCLDGIWFNHLQHISSQSIHILKACLMLQHAYPLHSSLWVGISKIITIHLYGAHTKAHYTICTYKLQLTHWNTNFLTLQRGAFKSQFRQKWQFCTFVFYSCKLIFIDFNKYRCCAVMLGWSLKCLLVSFLWCDTP